LVDFEYTDEFEEWWNGLSAEEQESVDFSMQLLATFGVGLRRPHADTVRGSRFPNMRKLRCQHQGRPLRVLYAFDPRRSAVVLLGGDKTGNARWYEERMQFMPPTWMSCEVRV
jgi:hypothetical protein